MSRSTRPERFTLTAEHLTLLRAMYVGWQDDEYGAPEIDPKRPYGNSSVEADIHKILHPDEAWDDDHLMPRALTPAEWEERLDHYRRLHRETDKALQIVIHHLDVAVGVYVREPYTSQPWKRVNETGVVVGELNACTEMSDCTAAIHLSTCQTVRKDPS